MFGIGWLHDAWNLLTGAWLPFAGAMTCLVGAAVAWFRVPLFGHYIGAGLIAVSAFLLGDVRGYMSARSDCGDAQLRARIATLEADLGAARSAAEDERRKSDELDALVLKHERELAEYADALKRRAPNAACTVTPDDLRAPYGMQ